MSATLWELDGSSAILFGSATSTRYGVSAGGFQLQRQSPTMARVLNSSSSKVGDPVVGLSPPRFSLSQALSKWNILDQCRGSPVPYSYHIGTAWKSRHLQPNCKRCKRAYSSSNQQSPSSPRHCSPRATKKKKQGGDSLVFKSEIET